MQKEVDSAFGDFSQHHQLMFQQKDSDRHTTVARLDQPIWTGGKLTSKYDIATSKEKKILKSYKKLHIN